MHVELRDIHKRFGQVAANTGISLAVPSGAIQGILGENGAGKSTLMKILSGYLRADAGEISLDGRPRRLRSPAEALREGIGMLHQDPLDFRPMRVLENFLCGRRGRFLLPFREARATLLRMAREFDFTLDPDAETQTLSVGERQQLEILRLLWLGARALILDEPTTGISADQKARLFHALQRLAAQGKTILLVSHKLDDVEQLCRQVAVLRAGRLVGTAAPPYRTGQLIEWMFGRHQAPARPRSAAGSRVLLQLDRLALEGIRVRLRDLSLEVREGEVIGLAGMEGNGQTLLLRACAGLAPIQAGRVALRGQELAGRSPRRHSLAGIAHLPAARLEAGLIPGLTVEEHFLLVHATGRWLLPRGHQDPFVLRQMAAYRIRGELTTPVESLSGGNQQRTLLALLERPLSLILMEHPTRGLDMASAAEAWGRIKERCARGTAVLFFSAELEEILAYSDRVVVFFGGNVSPPMPARQLTPARLGEMIGGRGWPAVHPAA